MSTKTQSRQTVAGLLLKRLGDEVLVGIHQSVKAYNDNEFCRHTTVGGGVEPDETPLQAMRRELEEEYGLRFSSECLIETLPIPTETNEGSNGTIKSYTWTLIIHQGESEPTLQLEECMNFKWCTLESVQDKTALRTFSEGKRLMLLRSLETAAWIRPEFFK